MPDVRKFSDACMRWRMRSLMHRTAITNCFARKLSLKLLARCWGPSLCVAVSCLLRAPGKLPNLLACWGCSVSRAASEATPPAQEMHGNQTTRVHARQEGSMLASRAAAVAIQPAQGMHGNPSTSVHARLTEGAHSCGLTDFWTLARASSLVVVAKLRLRVHGTLLGGPDSCLRGNRANASRLACSLGSLLWMHAPSFELHCRS
eukprot:scaffold36296_cov19-Tisochrysis_lutea.AAC.1